MKGAPFKAAKAAFDVKKIIAGDIHLWMAVIAAVRLVLHWVGESPIEGGSEALSVWIIMAVWGVLGVVKDIRKAKDTGPVSIVLLLALLSMSVGCSHAGMATMKKGFFKCGMQCLKTCMAGEMIKELAPRIISQDDIEDD